MSLFDSRDAARSDAASLVVDQRVGRRAILGGMAALGVASAFSVSRAFAQDATPSTTDDTGDTVTDRDAQRAADYQLFVSQLGAALQVTDTAVVDTAVRDALKAVVDQHVTDGDLAQNDADALKAEIDASEAPIALKGGVDRHTRPGRDRNRDSDDDDNDTDDDADGTDLIPASTPTA